jgi:DNA-binding XRE family transcriptional regulator
MEIEKELIGKTLEHAIKYCNAFNIDFRVVSVDGVGRPITADCVPERLNLYSVDDKIVKVTTG